MFNKRIINLFLFLFLASLIFYFSIIPGEPAEKGIPYVDKIEHFLAYFLLALSVYFTSKNKKMAFFTAGTYGLLMEILQFTLPYRNFSFADVLVNYIGAMLVVFIKNKQVFKPANY